MVGVSTIVKTGYTKSIKAQRLVAALLLGGPYTGTNGKCGKSEDS
jgi:hypothetical protein